MHGLPVLSLLAIHENVQPLPMPEIPPVLLLGFFPGTQAVLADTHVLSVFDIDTRSTIQVTLPNFDGWEPPEHDPNLEIPVGKAAEALRKYMDADQIPPETVAIEIDENGKLLSCNTNPEDDVSLIIANYLPLEEYQFPLDTRLGGTKFGPFPVFFVHSFSSLGTCVAGLFQLVLWLKASIIGL